jgi:hypothetical protein
MLLWASATAPGLITREAQQAIVDALVGAEQSDGGWSTASLGSWKRNDGTPLDVRTVECLIELDAGQKLPRLGQRADRFSIVRTMHHPADRQFRNEHNSTTYLLHTGGPAVGFSDPCRPLAALFQRSDAVARLEAAFRRDRQVRRPGRLLDHASPRCVPTMVQSLSVCAQLSLQDGSLGSKLSTERLDEHRLVGLGLSDRSRFSRPPSQSLRKPGDPVARPLVA